jgi:hypothetical protein
MIGGVIHLVWKGFVNAIIVLACISLIFIGYKANQPMTVTGVPKASDLHMFSLTVKTIWPIISL